MMLAAFLSERFDNPAALWLLLLVLLFWLISRRSLAGLSTSRRFAAIAARTLVLTLFVLAIAGLNAIRKSTDLAVIYLLDQSRSVPAAQQEEARRFVRATSRKPLPNDRVGAITFDGSAYIEQLPTKPGPDGGLFPDVKLISPGNQPDRTSLAAAVRTALACLPDDATRRLVLLSDGNENIGDVSSEVQAAAANRVAIDVVPLRYEYEREVMFERLAAPAYAREQEIATLRLTLRSRQQTKGRIQLLHDGRPVDLDPNSAESGQAATLQPGLNTFTVRLPLDHAGAHRFQARFEPDDRSADQIMANNVATAFTTVEGPARVLVVSARPDEDRPLVQALRREQLDVEWQRSGEATLDPVELQQFSSVILCNVPADDLSETQHRSLASYVRDLGGGLVMLGGDQGFGAGGWQSSVVEAVMPVRFDVDEVRQIPRGALALVMHACEMPQGNHWAVETAVAAMKTLSRLDYFGIVSYGNMGPGWEVPMRLCDDKRAIENRIRRMNHGDAPSFDELMSLAADGLISRRDAAQRHMIVISDGDPSPPSAGLINRLVGNRVTVSTVKVFPHGGFEIATMNNIAKQTGGNSYTLNKAGDEKRLPQIFIKEARVVRRPLLREEAFRPKLRDRMSPLIVQLPEKLPGMTGYVVTTPRRSPDVEMPLVSDKGDPLMAHWQCGLGRSVAFTSGWWNRWAPDWITWPGFSKLWAQTVRWCMAQGSAKDFDVATFVDGSRARVVVEALKKDANYLNFLQLHGITVGPTGEGRPLRLEQTGPGRYEGEFEMSDTGTHLINIRAAGAGAEPAVIRTGISVPYSPEFRELQTNDALLQRIANATGGRWLDAPSEDVDIFKHDLPPIVARRPLWNWLLKVAIFCFLLDVAVRRVAVDPKKALAVVRAYIADLAGRFGTGRRAEAVLADLKTVRQRVRDEQAQQAAASGPSATAEQATPRGTGRRFEAPETTKASEDLAGALGGPTTDGRTPSTATRDSAAEQGETTARLLKLKRRRQADSEGPPP